MKNNKARLFNIILIIIIGVLLADKFLLSDNPTSAFKPLNTETCPSCEGTKVCGGCDGDGVLELPDMMLGGDRICSLCSKDPGVCRVCKGMGYVEKKESSGTSSWVPGSGSSSGKSNNSYQTGEKDCFFCDWTGICSSCGGDGKINAATGSVAGDRCRNCEGSGRCHACGGDGIMNK